MDADYRMIVRRTLDDEHLRLLAIGHYVVAVIVALIACFPFVHVLFGAVFAALGASLTIKTEGMTGAVPGLMVMAMGLFMVSLGWAVSVCVFLSGRFLQQQRHLVFSFVMAVLLCLFIPFGTILGIFTLVVLSRESVRRSYAAAVPGGAPPDHLKVDKAL